MTEPFVSVLWHASRANIDRPTLAGRTVGTNHANSGLGLFCATEPASYIAGFGATVFALTLHQPLRVKRLSIRELAALGNQPGDGPSGLVDRAWFENLGRQWAQDFDVVALVESSGVVAQAIVLRDEAIAGCHRQTATEFLAMGALAAAR